MPAPAVGPKQEPPGHEERILAHMARVEAEKARRGLEDHRDGVPDPRNRRSCWNCGKTYYSSSGIRRCWACRRRRRLRKE